MKTQKLPVFLVALLCLAIGFVAGFFIAKRGVPFVTSREQWTIGIYQGDSPFTINDPLLIWNPVFKAEHVTDVPAKFVADPFLIDKDKTWYLFFEVYNNRTKQGDLAVATSTNLRNWKYQQVILDEPFHLSYPYVFEREGEYYLIPESYEDNSVRLYKADEFPTHWSYVTTLVEGREYVDNSIIYYNGKWWLFSSVTTNDTLYLHYADSLEGPWIEHPASPIVQNDNHKARPSGRMIVYEDRLYRFTMDIAPAFGTHQVMAYAITELTSTTYAEKLFQETPILQPDGSGWNRDAMHQLDAVEISPGKWVASVDGFGEYPIFGWNH
jgi:hypothetical protein